MGVLALLGEAWGGALGRMARRHHNEPVLASDYDMIWAAASQDGSPVTKGETLDPQSRYVARPSNEGKTWWTVAKEERYLSDLLPFGAGDKVTYLYREFGPREQMTTAQMLAKLRAADTTQRSFGHISGVTEGLEVNPSAPAAPAP